MPVHITKKITNSFLYTVTHKYAVAENKFIDDLKKCDVGDVALTKNISTEEEELISRLQKIAPANHSWFLTSMDVRIKIANREIYARTSSNTIRPVVYPSYVIDNTYPKYDEYMQIVAKADDIARHAKTVHDTARNLLASCSTFETALYVWPALAKHGDARCFNIDKNYRPKRKSKQTIPDEARVASAALLFLVPN